jgi:ATP-dependent RNA helicase HelY
MTCDRGDFEEYWEIQNELNLAESGTQRLGPIRMALETAKPGQVYLLPGGKARGRATVVGLERTKSGEPRMVMVTHDARTVKMGPRDFREPPEAVGHLSTTRKGRELVGRRSGGGRSRVDPQIRRTIAEALKALEIEEVSGPTPEDPQIVRLRAALKEHPCHDCPDANRHAQWAKRARRLDREIEDLKKRITKRTATLGSLFERVLEILEDMGYVSGFELTEWGLLLARIYGENDLLVAETLRRGWLEHLDPKELAAVTANFVYTSRGPFEIEGRLPTKQLKEVHKKIEGLSRDLQRTENRAGLVLTRGVETGFAEPIYRWCDGVGLDELLDEDLGAGDFIRSTKRTLDLLRQIRDSAPDDLRGRLNKAVDAIDRGVVSYTGIA